MSSYELLLVVLDALVPLDPPESDEPPEEDVDEDESLVVLVVLVLEVLAVLDALLLLLPSDLFDEPEYRSEYQPLPFKMKFPEVISRLSDRVWHFGQSLSASSVMRWTASNSCWQFWQRYEYVGM